MIFYLFFLLFTTSSVLCYYPNVPFLEGIFHVKYPKKKLVRFTQDNNEIIEKCLIEFKFHSPFHQFYLINHLHDNIFLLQNHKNASDILIIQKKE